jgi:pimeloyl-ACP methyl ester carboxylesterase
MAEAHPRDPWQGPTYHAVIPTPVALPPMTLPAWTDVDTNGIRMAAMVDLRREHDRPPVLLLHGFPELAVSWRHQIAALQAAGWGVVAPDLRGYGRTGPQGAVEDYRMANLALDVVGLLDALGIGRAFVVGHDFGGALAWTLARDHADRLAGVVSLNTPYTRRTAESLLKSVLKARGPDHYMVTFQTPGVGEALLGQDLETTFRSVLRRPKLTLAEFRRLPPRLTNLPASLFAGEPELLGEPILSDEELQVYIDAYRRTGFTGALNWYRNLDRNWEDTEGRPDRVDLPALMVSAEDDPFLPPEVTRGMEAIVPRLERHTIPACGHWTQQERPAEVNAVLLGWLQRQCDGRSR